MTVYLVSIHTSYEGHSLVDVFQNKQDAIDYCAEMNDGELYGSNQLSEYVVTEFEMK